MESQTLAYLGATFNNAHGICHTRRPAFHRTNSDLVQRFALPVELHEAGVRRYGFHGLSYEDIASALPRVDAKAAAGKTIVLHLGNGSSMCAMEAGRSVASTMGFTAVDGLPVGTRCGAIDPGVILYLMDDISWTSGS
jgi:acetate kinase